MLNFSDVEAPSNEKATDHIEIRVRPSDKERIVDAVRNYSARIANAG